MHRLQQIIQLSKPHQIEAETVTSRVNDSIEPPEGASVLIVVGVNIIVTPGPDHDISATSDNFNFVGVYASS